MSWASLTSQTIPEDGNWGPVMERFEEAGDGVIIHNKNQVMEESIAADESFISPYNSPAKEEVNKAAGDCVTNADSEHKQKQATAIYIPPEFDSATKAAQDKILSTFQNDILEELKKVSENTERNNAYVNEALPLSDVSSFAKGDMAPNAAGEITDQHYREQQKENNGILSKREKLQGNLIQDHHPETAKGENEATSGESPANVKFEAAGSAEVSEFGEQSVLHEPKAENVIPDVTVPDIPNAESEKENAFHDDTNKEKIIAEMMASAAETVHNEEMSHREMLSVSKKMEQEFRSLMIKEQQRKKLAIEGATHSSPSEVSCKALNTANEVTSTKEKKRVSRIPETAKTTARPAKSTTPRRATPSSKSSTLSRTSTPTARNTSSPSTVKQSNTASKSTLTTIRITPNSHLGTPHSTSERRSPLQPTTLRTNTPQQKTIISKSSPAISLPKSRQGSAIVTLTRTPRSTPAKSPTLSTPRRPLSAQSSETARSRAKMPDTKNVHSKIGSMQNSRHTPGGGKVKIESKKTDYSKVTSKIGSKTNLTHTPTGGKVKIESKKVDYSNVSSKCGSLANTKHTPGGGKVKIENKKLDFHQVTSKIGSRDNITHTPGGGKVKLESKKLDFSNVTSKCGSKANIKHVPQGGNVQIYHEKVDTTKVQSKIGSKDNIHHTPGGGKVKIVSKTLDLTSVKAKCGSLENAEHAPGGGNVLIFDEKPAFKDGARAKIGSLENADHVAGGGDVRIYDEKLSFKETAAARTNHGFNGTGSVGSSGSVTSM